MGQFKMEIRYQEVLLEEEKLEIKEFLSGFKLNYENDITYTIVCRLGNKIIGTASIANNIIKCFAVDCNYQGEGISLKLVTVILNKLNEKGIYHYFVYTMPKNVELFQGMAFNLISSTKNVSLLEGGISNIRDELMQLKKQFNISDKPKASIVMNCNPMTIGHFHLIEKCAKENEEVIVFIVEEDKSTFPFSDRIKIVKKAVQKLKNVKVIPSTKYIISSATFPTYFLKEDSDMIKVHALLDLTIFKNYFMPIFSINKRYVGKEPYCQTTSKYNEAMKKILKEDVVVIDRLESNKIENNETKEFAVSASIIRDLLKESVNISVVKELVPKETFEYLSSKNGQKAIAKIKMNNGRH